MPAAAGAVRAVNAGSRLPQSPEISAVPAGLPNSASPVCAFRPRSLSRRPRADVVPSALVGSPRRHVLNRLAFRVIAIPFRTEVLLQRMRPTAARRAAAVQRTLPPPPTRVLAGAWPGRPAGLP